MSIKLVVWDFDGTLADSLPTAVGIFNRQAPELGYRPLADVNAARGLPTRKFLKQQGISFWRLPRLVRKYRAAAAEEADKLKLIAGLPAALAALAATGVRLGVRVVLTENQKLFQSLGYVETSRDAHPGFDYPTSINMRKALESAKVEP